MLFPLCRIRCLYPTVVIHQRIPYIMQSVHILIEIIMGAFQCIGSVVLIQIDSIFCRMKHDLIMISPPLQRIGFLSAAYFLIFAPPYSFQKQRIRFRQILRMIVQVDFPIAGLRQNL